MPKRKATSSSGKKKKPALDWRVPIFYWRGTLTGKTWQGTWVASEFGLPSDDDFKASENTFKLECSEMLSLVAAGSHNSTKNWEAEGAKFTGSYKLDNGDGLEDTEDIEHLIWAVKGPPSHHPLGNIFDWATVGACGDTPFGRFVSLGRLDKKEALPDNPSMQYTRLTLARRYIDDADPRKKMSARDVCARVSSCGEDEWAINTPWLALPWKVPNNWPEILGVEDPEVRAKIEKNCEEEDTDWAVGLRVLY